MKANTIPRLPSFPVSCMEHRNFRVFWLFTLRNLQHEKRQTSAFYSPAPQRVRCGGLFVRLWLHLQPEEGASTLGLKRSSLGAEHRLIAINTNKVGFSPLAALFIQRRRGRCWKLFISDYVYSNSCSEYTRTLLARNWLGISVLNHCLL